MKGSQKVAQKRLQGEDRLDHPYDTISSASP